MNPIIALWSHPRSMSTAFERVMRERGDCVCFHEPFLYDYYVQRAVRPIPHFDVDPGTPVSYPAIRDRLLEAAESATVFFKDMSYFVVPALFDDPAFARRITHSFLIRNPLNSIRSYHGLDPAVTLEEIGLEAQWRHLDWLRQTFGTTPPVVEAEDIRRDPEAMIGAYWAAVGLPPAPHAFQWQNTETPEDWEQVAGWHETVSASTAIVASASDDPAAANAAFQAAAAEAPHLRGYLDHHRPFYTRLKALSLAAPGWAPDQVP